MRRILAGLLFCLFYISIAIAGEEARYRDYTFKNIPLKIMDSIEETLNQMDLFPARGMRDHFKAMGINEAFIRDDFKSYVLVKFNVEGDVKINEEEDLGSMTVYHIKTDSGKIFALFFYQMSEDQRKLIVAKVKSGLNRPMVKFKIPDLISKAHAQTCGSVTSGVIAASSLTAISAETIKKEVISCLKKDGSGVWDNTGGVIVSIEEASKFWNTPLQTLSGYANKVVKGVAILDEFIRLVGYSILHPEAGMVLLKKSFGPLGEALGQMLTAMVMIPVEAVVQVSCYLAATVGGSVALGIVAGGAALLKSKNMLEKIVSMFEKLKPFFSLIQKLGDKAWSELKLAPEAISKIIQGVLSGKVKEKSLDTLAKASALGSDMSRLALRGILSQL